MTCCVYLLFCSIILLVPNETVGRRRTQNNDVNIKKITDRLDIIENELKALKENIPDQNLVDDLSLNPLEASRNVTDEGVLFTVKYAKDGQSKVMAIWSRYGGSGGTSRVVLSDGAPLLSSTLGKTQYLTQADSEYVHLFLSTKYVSYFIRFHNYHQGNITLPITAPKFELEKNDLTYLIGQNATFKVKSPNFEMKERREGPGSNDNRINLRFQLVDLNTGQYVGDIYSGEDKSVYEKKEKTFFDYVETTYIINTAENNVSGFVQIRKPDSYNSNILIGNIAMSRILTLHPKQQQGPFPSGLMVFQDDFGGAIEEGKTKVITCSKDEHACSVICIVLGSDLKSLKLVKLLPNETTTLPDNVVPIIKDTTLDYWQELKAEIPTLQSKEEQRRYKCIASNRLGKSISHTIEIIPVIKTKIDTEGSSLFINGQNATLTCTAVGDPLPSVKFDIMYNYQSYHDQDPDDVVVSGDTVIATKHIVYDDGDDQGYYAQSTGKLYTAVCKAVQIIPQINSTNPNSDNFYYQIEN